jgi:hypothetical protein
MPRSRTRRPRSDVATSHRNSHAVPENAALSEESRGAPRLVPAQQLSEESM